MLQKLTDWIFNRALRLSHSATVAIAKKVGVSADVLSSYNDAIAGAAAEAVAQEADKAE